VILPTVIARIRSIVNDPLATAEDVEYLRAHDETKALQHPNCWPKLWWFLAAAQPIAAQQSVLYELMLLENPGGWEQLEKKYAEFWIHQAIDEMPLQERHLFAADCAERVLPFFEDEHPTDMRPRTAVDRRRLFALGEISLKRWHDARLDAHNAARRKRMGNAAKVTATADIHIVATESANVCAIYRAQIGPLVDILAAGEDVLWTKTKEIALHEERLWQWARAQCYLKELAT